MSLKATTFQFIAPGNPHFFKSNVEYVRTHLLNTRLKVFFEVLCCDGKYFNGYGDIKEKI